MAPKDWPDLRNDPCLQAIAQKHGKSVVQVMLNWGLARGHVVIPKATGLDHQQENMNVFDFKLSEEDMEAIKPMDSGRRLCNKFEIIGGYDFFA